MIPKEIKAARCRFCGDKFWSIDERCPVRQNGFSHVCIQNKDRAAMEELEAEGFTEREIYSLLANLPTDWKPAAEVTGHTGKGFLSVHAPELSD